jgi:hypothetical protein
VPDKQRPIAHVEVGSVAAVAAAIWKNDTRDKPRYTASFNVRYRDSDGEWKTTNGFDQAHLLELTKCADLAWDAIAALRKSDSEGHSPG